jgi:radical SAM superfamily enzyme YgiQ (UPF0313 family)
LPVETGNRGILIIASVLENQGYSVKLYDFELETLLYTLGVKKYEYVAKESLESLAKIIMDNDPAIIGVTSVTASFIPAKRILEHCKRINPDVLTLFGGPHVSALDVESLQESEAIDVVVRGEGELIVQDLMEKIETRNFDKVRGITFRKDGEIRRNEDGPLPNLDEIPLPAYHLLPPEVDGNVAITMMTSRGCPYRCTYCQESRFMRKVRFRDPRKVCDELELVKNIFPKLPLVNLQDSIFTLSTEHILGIYQEMKKRSIEIFISSVESRVDLINEEKVDLLNKMNVLGVTFGVESASERVRKIMNREMTMHQVLDACRITKEKIPLVTTNWIVGHPGETWESIFQSFDAATHLVKNNLTDTIVKGVFIPLPGTPPFHEPERFGLKIISRNWNRYGKRVPPPPYRLQSLSPYEIWAAYCAFEALECRLLCDKFGLTFPQGWK